MKETLLLCYSDVIGRENSRKMFGDSAVTISQEDKFQTLAWVFDALLYGFEVSLLS